MKSGTKPDTQDDDGWMELFSLVGRGLLLLIRWPFAPFWKKREFDYDSPNPLPKNEVPYLLLCILGIILEAEMLFMVFGLYFGVLHGPSWTVWVIGGLFAVSTGIRIYMYGRNEAHGWHW